MPSWFRTLTGFEECDYADTQSRLRVAGDRLNRLVNGSSWDIGQFETPSLDVLRCLAFGRLDSRDHARL